MNLLRKFYDAALEEPATQIATEQPSIAELMAKHGVQNSSAEPIAQPIEKLEKKEETNEVKEETPVATTTDPVKTELVKPESPAKEEPKEESKPQKVDEAPPKVQQWQEVLKSQQPDTVLKELGFDEKTVSILNELKGFDKIDYFTNFVKSWKEGKADSYLKELTTDYLKMSPEEVMRHQLREEFPKATEAQLNVLYKNEVVKKYNLDSEDDDEIKEGQLLLEAKADKYRDTLVERQKEKLLPPVPEPKAAEPDPHEEAVKNEQNRIRKNIEDNPYTKSILSSKELIIGEGEDEIKFPIDADSVLDLVINGEPTGDYSFNIERNPDKSIKSLTPKVEHQILVQTVNKYGMEFIHEIVKKAKALGGEKAIKPIENAKPPEKTNASPSETAPKSPAEAMAKQGRLNTGG